MLRQIWRNLHTTQQHILHAERQRPFKCSAFKADMGKTFMTDLAAALQTLFFKADTAKAFTTVLAGFALTFISWPNIKRLPAFVAALCFVLIMQTPGIVNLPVPFTSLPASVAKASKTFAISDFLCSHAVANASAMAPFAMDLTPAFIAFIAFLAIGTDK